MVNAHLVEEGGEVTIVDAAMARGDVKQAGQVMGSIRPIPMLRVLVWASQHGLLRVRHIGVVETFGDPTPLDLPRAPRVVLAPGHTAGSAALQFARHGALFAGDALATYAVTTGRTGPQIAPSSEDPARAIESLARLEAIDAALVLPGHGAPFAGSPAEAVRLALAAEATSRGEA